MANSATTQPVSDSVPKVNNEIAVGDDLEFQQRWWRFERALWLLFLLIVILDLIGVFGRGFLANSSTQAEDGSLHMKYERIERFRTPSLIQLGLTSKAVEDGKIKLWVSDTIIKPLGNQRIIPQPLTSELDGEGVLYTFPASAKGNSVEFALEPGSSGFYQFGIHVLNHPGVQAKILVVP